jgi:hypothetical protein
LHANNRAQPRAVRELVSTIAAPTLAEDAQNSGSAVSDVDGAEIAPADLDEADVPCADVGDAPCKAPGVSCLALRHAVPTSNTCSSRPAPAQLRSRSNFEGQSNASNH